MDLVLRLLERVKEAFPLNRVVALLTPPVSVAAGLVSAWLADHLPLVADQVGKNQLTAIFLAAAASVASAGYKWLDGWQLHEQHLHEQRVEELAAQHPDGDVYEEAGPEGEAG